VPGAGQRLRWLLAVLAVIVTLTAGWPLVSTTVAGDRPLAAGTTVTVGPSRASSGRVTVGPGWSVLTARSDPNRSYSLARGALRLSVRYVSLVSPPAQASLWRGLRQVLRIGNPGLTPGRPRVFTTSDGSQGLIAFLSGPGRTGQAAALAAPDGTFAIEMIMLGPPGTARVMRSAGLPVLRSLRFPAAAP
jgi:hypothetical protein